MAWLMLVCAGLLEVVWALALKHSDGFTRLWPSLLGISGAMVSFILLAAALRHVPVGTGYAIWVGIGAVGVAVAGVFTIGETLSAGRLLFLGMIVVGVVGLRLVEG